MPVNGVNAASSAYYSATTATGKNDDVSKDAFLLLLVTQLKNQDPLEPMKDHEFLAQLAQFNALEQLQNLGQQARVNQAFALLGKEVTAVVGDNLIEGVVEKVWLAEGEPYLLVGERAVKLSQVIQVGNSSDVQEPPQDGGEAEVDQ